MAKEIIINHTSHETRVAVIEGGELSELYHEREKRYVLWTIFTRAKY